MNRLGTTIIVDASVAVKWLAPEPDSGTAEAVAEGRTLAAPELLLVECANILWLRVRKGEIPRRDATTGLMDLRSAFRH
ncbi:type II toxin-antitoxin system VapC family toxin [Azospirillum canadense]|uniref:type II toxin-antitoxin system VapC family toxin n=1 Tax=Azospirillum canadense TaxID=403962 RepID=UPI0022263773|nr:type II toxin-antitoxin system VapC family toxin [Azospirillum canadense]MCW2238242.1 putative nucleic acid-binding protein [Azospirillum canadense]